MHEKPITPLMADSSEPEWQQILSLFSRHGAPEPSTRLRDELVTMLAWARYGASAAPSGQAPLEGVKEAQHAFNLELLANVVEAERWPAIIAPVAARQLREAAKALHPLLPASAEPVAWQYRVMFDEGHARGNEWCDWHLTVQSHFDALNIQIADGRKRVQTRRLYASPPASGAVETGWQLVPKEPTDAMIEAAAEWISDKASWGGQIYGSDVWGQMLSAAPTEGE